MPRQRRRLSKLIGVEKVWRTGGDRQRDNQCADSKETRTIHSGDRGSLQRTGGLNGMRSKGKVTLNLFIMSDGRALQKWRLDYQLTSGQFSQSSGDVSEEDMKRSTSTERRTPLGYQHTNDNAQRHFVSKLTASGRAELVREELDSVRRLQVLGHGVKQPPLVRLGPDPHNVVLQTE
ncbi:hypothetical protein F2P81_018515 [Scophthalmus maximus]|uniref:Uncharacterized protein n=1 Tax=Scophthalmus maximus TaxID=52904 RepID=A0A6A4SCD1_SCOMX|nr:hypothetical protein F2P81_018515 [Scophthalmus maximus]